MNLTKTEIIDRVNSVMHQGFEIPHDKLTPQATIAGDLGLDSLDAIDMLVQLEEQMGVKVSGERLMSVKKLEDIYTLIEDISAENAAAPTITQ
jgi:acyl carrier protein